MLVRRDAADRQWIADHPAPDGLRAVATFDDADVFAVTAPPPAIYTKTMTGFFPREHDAAWTWRWMGEDAAWGIVNTRGGPVVATLSLEIVAFPHRRTLEVRLAGSQLQTLVVDAARRTYEIGPLVVPAGSSELVFHPAEAPAVAGDIIHNGDPRSLSLALGSWHWIVPGTQP